MIFFGKRGDRRPYIKEEISEKKELSNALKDWLYSQKRDEMLCGYRYYCGKNDILARKREVIGENGKLVEDKTLSNQRIAHSFFKKLVDQKCQYLFGLPFTVSVDDDDYARILENIFDCALRKKIQNLCKEAIIKGVAWLQPYFDGEKIKFKKIPAEEILPIYSDRERTDISAVLRIYNRKRNKKIITQVEYWTTDGVEYFILENGKLSADALNPKRSHITINGEGYNFKNVPFIPFKYNEEEISLIRYTKHLIDDYDLLKSDDSNAICDTPNSILVVKNYDGQGLGEFRKNLSQYKAVKVTDDGGLDIKNTELSTDMVQKHLAIDRKDLYEAGRGVDTQSDEFKNTSGVALKFLYADLDLDCNSIESEFLSGFEKMTEFIALWLSLCGKGEFSDKKVKFILNRDVVINEEQAIEDCVKSQGIISHKTILENHPWVKNLNEELTRLEDNNG